MAARLWAYLLKPVCQMHGDQVFELVVCQRDFMAPDVRPGADAVFSGLC